MVIGICDDQKPTRDLIRGYIDIEPYEDDILCFGSGHELLDYVRNGGRLDIVFLDIDFRDDMDGMAVAAAIKEDQVEKGSAGNSLPLIIFVTGMPERMQEAFSVRAFQFLVKPINAPQVCQILELAKKEVRYIQNQNQEAGSFEVNIGGKTVVIDPVELLYIESKGRKLLLYSTDESVEFYSKMADMMEILPECFFRVHRSFIINLAQVSSYDRTKVKLKDGTEIPMSRYQYKDFLDVFMEYSTGRSAL